MKLLGVLIAALLGYTILWGDMSRQGRAWAVAVLLGCAFMAGRFSKGSKAVATAIAEARAEVRADLQANAQSSLALYQQFTAAGGAPAGVPAALSGEGIEPVRILPGAPALLVASDDQGEDVEEVREVLEVVEGHKK